eukprot:19357-Prorocentrum_minimum.AAC.2
MDRMFATRHISRCGGDDRPVQFGVVSPTNRRTEREEEQRLHLHPGLLASRLHGAVGGSPGVPGVLQQRQQSGEPRPPTGDAPAAPLARPLPPDHTRSGWRASDQSSDLP